MFKWLKGLKTGESRPDVRALQPAPDTSEMGDADSSEIPLSGSSASGQTVFSAETLNPAFRFRSLTVAQPDTSVLEGNPAQQPAFKIRFANSGGFSRAAGGLVKRRYADRGYLIPQVTNDPHLFTFLAYDEGEVVGTLSVRVDSKEKGLSADALYADELDELRSHYGLCEFTRLAVDVKSASKPVLAGLFHTAYLYAQKVCGLQLGVIEVNPRHVPFYRRSLKYEPLGPERNNQRVNAPAVLMSVPFDMMEAQIAQFGGKPETASTQRTLYPYFFSLEEEAGIFNRLKDLNASAAP